MSDLFLEDPIYIEEKGISFIFRDKELQKTINHLNLMQRG